LGRLSCVLAEGSKKRKRGREPKPESDEAVDTWTDTERRVLAFHFEHSSTRTDDINAIEYQRGRSPLSNYVAKKLRISVRAVEKARKRADFDKELLRLHILRATGRIAVGKADKHEETDAPILPAFNLGAPNAYTVLSSNIREQWTGPVVSPVDSAVYSSPEEFASHLLEHKLLALPRDTFEENKKRRRRRANK
jgi:hypothetical protein